MNSEGRHYRDPSDTSNPICDYESKGRRCDFFASGHEHASLPYPQDVSLGPNPTQEGRATEFSQILELLQKQKDDTDRQFADIQKQVTALSGQRGSAGTETVPTTTVTVATTTASQGGVVTVSSSVSSPRVTTSALPTTQVHPSTVLMPPPSSLSAYHGQQVPGQQVPTQSLANAALALNSHLNTGLGQNHNLGYEPLTLEQLRRDPRTAHSAELLLQQEVRNIAPLNPLSGMGQSSGTSNQVSNSTVDQLYAATMRNKQLKAYEFAATGHFSYKSQLKQDNLNAILFAYGSFKHLEAAKLGLIHMQDVEFLARLRHLKNVFEIACLSSNLNSFSDQSWLVAREYDTRVISDIESGSKSWSSLSTGLETDALYCANQIVDLKMKSKNKVKDKDSKKLKGDKESSKKPCTTFNTHRVSDGCYWEHNNRGETCIFEHYCSWCKTNRDVKEKHKAFECEFKSD